MTDYVPAFDGGTVAFTASTDITGGLAVEITGDREVGIAGAASTAYIGVAAFDTAEGDKVTIHLPGKVQRLQSAGAITAGATVQTGADGTVEAGTTAPIGKALTSATGAGETILVADRI